jgi:hypothetical protein
MTYKSAELPLDMTIMPDWIADNWRRYEWLFQVNAPLLPVPSESDIFIANQYKDTNNQSADEGRDVLAAEMLLSTLTGSSVL